MRRKNASFFLFKPARTLKVFEWESGECKHFAHFENKVIVNYLWTAVVLSGLWRRIWLFFWWMETDHFDQIGLWTTAASLLPWLLDTQILAHKFFQCLWGMGRAQSTAALDCFRSCIYRTIGYSSSRYCTCVKEEPGVAVKLIQSTIGPLVWLNSVRSFRTGFKGKQSLRQDNKMEHTFFQR